MRIRHRRRVVWALLASTLVHLLLLAAYLRMADWYRQQDLKPTRYLPDLLLLTPELFRQQQVTRIPERLLEKVEATPEPTLLPDLSLPTPPPAGLGDSVQVASGLDSVLAIGGRPLVFVPQAEAAGFDLNERQMEAVRQLREERDSYARIWVPDADTTDAESRARSRAEVIVARAFAAMGGIESLRRIHEMRAVVWLMALETLEGEGRGARIRKVPPYAYPIATWHMYGRDHFDRDVFREALDLSVGATIPAYASRNPASSRQAYYRLFDARWHLYAPVTTRPQRQQAERERWHFCDWFLGEGIRLSYAGTGRIDTDGPLVDRVRIDDRKFGRHQEAFFDPESGLLLAIREVLNDAEAQWYQQKNARRAPEWITTFGDYRPVAGVLLPHRWVRSAPASVRITVSTTPHGSFTNPIPLTYVDLRFNLAVNDAHPDTVAPEL